MVQIRSPFDLYLTWLNFSLMVFFQLVQDAHLKLDLYKSGRWFFNLVMEGSSVVKHLTRKALETLFVKEVLLSEVISEKH